VRNDLPEGAPVRVQVHFGITIESEDLSAP
jgi:hypothetical protein